MTEAASNLGGLLALTTQALEAAGAITSNSSTTASSSTAHSLGSLGASGSAAVGAGGAGGGAAAAGGDTWVVSVREKALVDVLLSAAAAAPNVGLMLAELAWGLGPGVGEELLRRMDWLLQVGHQSIQEESLKR